MATTIPNFMSGYQSPLGGAFRSLAQVMMSQPTQAEQMTQAAQFDLMRAQGRKAEEDAALAASKGAGRTRLGSLLADPRLADPTFSPVKAAAPKFSEDPTDPLAEGVASTPINRAFQPNYGDMTQAAVEADINPNDLGGYLRFIAANTGGVRDPRTTNAQVGAGQSYTTSAESFDFGEDNKIKINDADNKQSAANADLQAKTTRATNAEDNAMRWRIAQLSEAGEDRRSSAKDSKADQTEAEAARQRAATADVVLGKITEARDIIGGSTLPTGGFVGKTLADNVPGTDAYTLDRTIDTIKANLGFEQLAAMRAASPTGGALGNVTEKELAMLQATVSSLDSGLPTAQKMKNLDDIERHYANVKMLMQGKLPPEYQQQNPAPNAPAPQGRGSKNFVRDPRTGKLVPQ